MTQNSHERRTPKTPNLATKLSNAFQRHPKTNRNKPTHKVNLIRLRDHPKRARQQPPPQREQRKYCQYISTIPKPQCIAPLSATAMSKHYLTQKPPSVAFQSDAPGNQIINATTGPPPRDNHVCIKRRTHKSQTMLTSLQIRGGNFRVLLPNNQELKTRSYTRPQLSENIQNITRHNRFKRSLFAHQKQNYHIQCTIHKQKELHLHTRMHTDQT